jgi:hypothetical protein
MARSAFENQNGNNSNVNSDNSTAEITISGYIQVGVKIGDFSKAIKIRK